MANQVSIIYNADGQEWTDYLQRQIEDCEMVDAQTFLLLDTNLFSTTVDSRAETRILQSGAVLVIVTPHHMDFLLSNDRATYERLVPHGENGILLLVGVTEDQITETHIRAQTRSKFPNYDSWSKVGFTDENSVRDLLEKVVEVLEKPEAITSNFTVNPTSLISEQDNIVVVMIDAEIPKSAKVKAVIKGTYLDCTIRCQYVNPYTFKFIMPSCEEGEATIYMEVDGRSLGTQAKVYYKSYLSCADATAINEIYCHLLDNMCKFIKAKTNLSVGDVDMNMSEIFDHTIDLPAVGYEKLFGIYQFYNEEHSRTMVPSLVHLAARHDLKEMMAKLQDLPHFLKVLSIINREKKRPRDIAALANNKDLASFIEDLEESIDLYSEMLYGDKGPGYQIKGYQNKDAQVDTIQEAYSDHDFRPVGEYAEMKSHTPGGYNTPVRPPAGNMVKSRSFGEDPSENYMDMEGLRNSSRSVSESDSYQSVPDVQERTLGKKPGFLRTISNHLAWGRRDKQDENTKKGSMGRPAAPPVSSDRDPGVFRMGEVQKGLVDWQKSQGGTGATTNNFAAKQEKVKNARKELTKVVEDKKSKPKKFFGKSKNVDKTVKQKPDNAAKADSLPRDQKPTPSKFKPGSMRKDIGAQYVGRDTADKYVRKTPPAIPESVGRYAAAGAEYVGRDAVAPPVPERPDMVQYVSSSPAVPPRHYDTELQGIKSNSTY